ncbi:serine/threonine-protein kinase [Streptomyces sp. NPDC049813]|uniref:serine/threonine-protein kinase n=1 Tax=Streptomyces sp. NPDC049813 TaxID=3365597 RepID=UPI0037B7F0FA
MNGATGVFEPLAAEDPRTVAGYRLAARLGAGGMGRVYLSHTQGGRPVAIKVVRPELADDAGFRLRFRREMDAARRVRGAYTAELIDGDADGVPPWLATLYVPGPSLAQAVARRGPLPVPALLWLTAGVAEALQAIHATGIVHRDLKPSNVLLAADGPRVIDFGISLAFDGTAYTATGATVGTPQFMAPEQASGSPVTAATDVFSLAQTVAFAALGEPLYGDGPAVGVLYRIVHDTPDLSRLPAGIRPLLARCLVADPARRATLAEIVAWCRDALGRDADAGPPDWQEAMGPEVAVPPPVPAAGTPAPTHPFGTQALSPWRAPDPLETRPTPEQARRRRRRVALAGVAGATAAVLALGGLGWRLWDAREGSAGRDATAAGSADSGGGPASGTSATSDSSDSSGGPASAADGSGTAAGAGGAGRGSGSGSGTGTGAGAAASPVATPYPMQMLTEKNSLDITDGVEHKDRTGDIRFTCAKEFSCALETTDRGTVIAPVYGDPGTGLDDCRAWLKGKGADTRLPLAIITTGSEICFQHPDGYVGLFVVQAKSTALPKSGSSFLSGSLTVWRTGKAGR